GWQQPEGSFYLLGEGMHYACAFGGFAAIILGSMLINDFYVLRSNDLKKEALWYQETAFEEGKILLGQFFQENEEEKKKFIVKLLSIYFLSFIKK
ncbi:hypothetical protein MUO66_03830, partial [Candidatus Bathyarchaeota archaeon]|nr:hypothetical protein [Candidatus Bathyarchaeota archaeon]